MVYPCRKVGIFFCIPLQRFYNTTCIAFGLLCFAIIAVFQFYAIHIQVVYGYSNTPNSG